MSSSPGYESDVKSNETKIKTRRNLFVCVLRPNKMQISPFLRPKHAAAAGRHVSDESTAAPERKNFDCHARSALAGAR